LPTGLRSLRGAEGEDPLEVDASIERLFVLAAWPTSSTVRSTGRRSAAWRCRQRAGRRRRHRLALRRDLAFVSLMGAAIAMGNCAVMVPSERQALIATDLYQVLDTSDVPPGVVNIVTGDKRSLGLELARHDTVDAIPVSASARCGRAGEGLDRQSSRPGANRGARLVRSGNRRRQRSPPSRHPGEEHLDPYGE
jgi:aldehyde dehydrogenase (NAD+)